MVERGHHVECRCSPCEVDRLRERAQEAEGWIGAVNVALGNLRGRCAFVDDAVALVVAEGEQARKALAELVALDDGPWDEDDYRRRKPLAWQAARDVLAREEID